MEINSQKAADHTRWLNKAEDSNDKVGRRQGRGAKGKALISWKLAKNVQMGFGRLPRIGDSGQSSSALRVVGDRQSPKLHNLSVNTRLGRYKRF